MRKTFNLTDEDVLRHLSKQSNQSKYIEMLIREDMSFSNKGVTEDEVVKIVLDILSTYKIESKNEEAVSVEDNPNKNLLQTLALSLDL